MSGWVIVLVLFSALLHAGWNFLVKRGQDGQLDTALFAMGCSVIAAFLLPFTSLPDASCYPWLMASLVVHVAYFLTLSETYKYSDLSLAYPLMRGMAPLWVLVFAAGTGEWMAPLQIMGIVLIGIGIVLPAWIGKPWKNRKGLYFSLLNAAIIAVYTLLDGTGVRLSNNALSYTLWLFLFNSWGILGVLMWRRGLPEVIRHVREGWRMAGIGAGMSMGSYAIVLWAMTQASIPAVAALREISVIFAALLGTWFLGERMGRWRIMGAALVGIGAASVRWS